MVGRGVVRVVGRGVGRVGWRGVWRVGWRGVWRGGWDVAVTSDETRAAVIGGICAACGIRTATDCHELKRGSYYRQICRQHPSACLGLCSECHTWVTLNPRLALERGLAWTVAEFEAWATTNGIPSKIVAT